MKRDKKVILLCEIGWRRAREEAISLAIQGIFASVLIKGLPDREVRQMITDHSGIKNIFIPRYLFSTYITLYILLNIFTGKSLSLVVEAKDKIYRRLVSIEKIWPRVELKRLH